MERTDNGFVAEIKMLNYNSFNFCFRNSNYEWDNNNYQNYGALIAKEEIKEEINTKEKVTETFIDEDVIDTKDTEDDASCFEANVEKNDPLNIEESLVNSIEEPELTREIDTLFEDLYDNSSNKQELLNNILSTNSSKQEFSMNSLIDEILSPIVSSEVFEEENELNYKEENLSLAEELKSDEKINNLIDDLILDIYKNVDENTNTVVTEEPTSTAQEVKPIAEEPVIEEIVEEEQEPSIVEEISPVKIVKEIPAQQEEKSLIVSPRSLSKFYVIRKKIKIAFYKLLRLFPKGTSSSNIEQ
jgi:hypothetical protein